MNTVKNTLDPDLTCPAIMPIEDAFNRPLRDLRISVTDQCNLQCNSCRPAPHNTACTFIPNEKNWLSVDEIARFSRILIQMGVLKIRLTGGEPLLRKDVLHIIKKIRSDSPKIDIALTTNGTLLKRYAQPLKAAGLTRITVRLDTLDKNLFSFLNGNHANVDQILKGIKAAEEAGFFPIKINAVIQKGLNDRTMVDLIKFFRGTPHILRFIEYMDVGNQNDWTLDKVVPSENLRAWINERFPLAPLSPNYKGEVAKRYRYQDNKGEIGFISAVSQPFCDTCHRLRLSADGKLYLCLFASQGIDIKPLLRAYTSDDIIRQSIKKIWTQRREQYSQKRYSNPDEDRKFKKVEMYEIGG